MTRKMRNNRNIFQNIYGLIKKYERIKQIPKK